MRKSGNAFKLQMNISKESYQTSKYYLEYVSNIIWFCNQKYYGESTEDEYIFLQENVIGVLDDLGYEAKVFEDEEKVILVEKKW